MREIEAPIHRSILHYLRTVLPDALVHHSANEREGAAARMRADSLGTVAGYPDLTVHVWGGMTLFFEVKGPKGKLSDRQSAVIARLIELGNRVAVVRSVDDVRARLAEWGIWTREKRA